ncbi:TPA: hypothetical protein EYG96_02955 [Candidatus Gracilibacteria bacterium]|nr:hypothetical protein [Candidatus Peregrinibacteria bacterium]HIQ56972.1 hypothetical protein [Candidatus Gracilibacteria bacterium]HIQ57357.1 hypothetical protein [Candidatus Gracilibacteria bacterium]
MKKLLLLSSLFIVGALSGCQNYDDVKINVTPEKSTQEALRKAIPDTLNISSNELERIQEETKKSDVDVSVDEDDYTKYTVTGKIESLEKNLERHSDVLSDPEIKKLKIKLIDLSVSNIPKDDFFGVKGYKDTILYADIELQGIINVGEIHTFDVEIDELVDTQYGKFIK